MSSTNFTPELLKALEEAYAKGVLEVRYQDRVIKYDSEAGLLRRINYVKECLGLTKRRGRVFVKTDKGLGC